MNRARPSRRLKPIEFERASRDGIKSGLKSRAKSNGQRILRKHGYPPDKQEAATNTVLQQAELLSDFWTLGASA